ncbi:dicarboxylate/amino acid:cation symporter [Desmospora activa]|uniref:Na+/H+-dicarboxylate symporter n=1 Tax=Desmospora activa DSM 45169 TaxID=1121389 RepID=A0A2T4ZDN7_9BACL|nr:dicarboxylate/amino acid:cation symporter [Desmospora activa]PTM60011.1 hypothetical protein C8J48_2650 [Desmospora activa DSM 45169]
MWLMWSVAVVLLLLLFSLKQFFRISFGIRVLIAMLLGVAFGAYFGETAEPVKFFGQAFVSLIKMLVIPLVVTALLTSITRLRDPSQLRKIGTKTIAWFLLTAIIASGIGIAVGTAINPGAGIQMGSEQVEAREIPPVSEVFLDMIPSNIVSQAADDKILPIILFTIILGIAISIESQRDAARVKPFQDFIEAFSRIIFRVTKLILKLTPYGVFGLLASVAASYGLDTLLPLTKMIAAVYLACLIHMVITYGSIVTFVAKVNPIRFFRKIYPAVVVAFSTRSSYGTLPVTIKTLTNRVKVSEKISSFVAPLGATMNMDACGGLYPAVTAIFVATVFGIDLGVTDYLLLIGTATLASIGTAGVPGTASIMTTVVLSSLGLPLEGLALVLGIDALLDMGRTAVNVTGDTVVSLVVADSEGEFDREAFNNNDSPDELELNTPSNTTATSS